MGNLGVKNKFQLSFIFHKFYFFSNFVYITKLQSEELVFLLIHYDSVEDVFIDFQFTNINELCSINANMYHGATVFIFRN